MDERQTQIKEGAGLDESRLNQDFIELLRKWSTPALLVLAIVAFSFYGVQQWKARAVAIVDRAFVEYENARNSGAEPRVFIALAEEHKGVRSVALMAKLDAADGFLGAVLSGILPGFKATTDGTIVYLDNSVLDEDDPPQTLLTETDQDSFLSQAETIYQSVIAESEEDEGTRIFGVSAAFGLTAIAETRGDMDEAKASLERAAAMAEANGFESQVVIARNRIESLGEIAARPVLYETDSLPVIEEPEPEVPPAVIPSPMDAEAGPQPIAPEGAGENADPASSEGDPAGEGGGEEAGEGPGGETTEKTAEKAGEGGGENEGGGGEKEGGEGGGGSPAP